MPARVAGALKLAKDIKISGTEGLFVAFYSVRRSSFAPPSLIFPAFPFFQLCFILSNTVKPNDEKTEKEKIMNNREDKLSRRGFVAKSVIGSLFLGIGCSGVAAMDKQNAKTNQAQDVHKFQSPTNFSYENVEHRVEKHTQKCCNAHSTQ